MRHDYEDILFELEKLKETSETTPILVEGKRDEEALRELGIEGKIFKVSSGGPLLEICEQISKDYSNVILLTDLDAEGHKIARFLKSSLSRRGVKINERFRFRLMHRLDTNAVEHLSKMMRKTEDRVFKRVTF